MLTKIVWEIRRPNGMHFEERTLEPLLNRSVVCFKAGTSAPPLVLRWSPDFGFVCCRTDIKLT